MDPRDGTVVHTAILMGNRESKLTELIRHVSRSSTRHGNHQYKALHFFSNRSVVQDAMVLQEREHDHEQYGETDANQQASARVRAS